MITCSYELKEFNKSDCQSKSVYGNTHTRVNTFCSSNIMKLVSIVQKFQLRLLYKTLTIEECDEL